MEIGFAVVCSWSGEEEGDKNVRVATVGNTAVMVHSIQPFAVLL